MLEFFMLGVAHDAPRIFVFLDCKPLLIPPDRLGLFNQRGDHAREGARLRRKLVRRLVVLVEWHGVLVKTMNSRRGALRDAGDSSCVGMRSLRGYGEFRRSTRPFSRDRARSRNERTCR